MPGNIGPLELGIVLVIALVVFGPKRLPELGRSLGRGIREFKGSISGEHDDDDDEKPSEAARTEIAATPTAPPESKAREDEPAVHDRS
jgi:sec-independent protein translocase protein TatA